VQVGVFHARYLKWCRDNNEHELNIKRFSQRLQERGIELRTGARNKKFAHGVRLVAEELPLDRAQ